MIRIIKGIYGYKNKDNVIEPKTCTDEPFSLTKEQEARLVSKGVAEYVEVAPVQPQDERKSEETKMPKGNLDKEKLMEWGYNELKRLAKEMGIPAIGTKEELVDKIVAEKVAYTAEDEEGADDGEGKEEPPAFNPEEPQ